MEDIQWVVKHRDEINNWYSDLGVFGDDALYEDGDSKAYYESYVVNYVAANAEKFTGKPPNHIWHELDVHDFRLKEIETDPNVKPWWKGRVKPDLLLQFDDAIWVIEVKFGFKSPNLEAVPTMKGPKSCIDQVSIYVKRLENMMTLGWFPNMEIHPVVVWAFWEKRVRPSEMYMDAIRSEWPYLREDPYPKP